MYRRTIRLILCYAFGLIISVDLYAQSTAEQIRKINEEISILTIQLQKLEIEAKINQKKLEMRKSSVAGDPAFLATDRLPVVQAIEGVEGRLNALIVSGDGNGVMVSEGDKLGDFLIKKISPQSVVVERGRQTVRLSLGRERSMELPILPPSIGMHESYRGR